MLTIRAADHELTDNELTAWLRQLRANGHTPESGYRVAAVFRVRHRGAEYYVGGVNVENTSHRLSTHGEEGGIAAMVTALGPDAQITRGWLMGAPETLQEPGKDAGGNEPVTCCGKCRQQVAAFADGDAVMRGFPLNDRPHQDLSVATLLPEAFTERHFKVEAATTDSSGQAPFTIEQAQRRLVRECPPDQSLSKEEISDWLKQLRGKDDYSKISQAVVVRLENGAYVAGTNVDDIAFLAINPVQSAMAVATAEYGTQKVKEVWSSAVGRDKKHFDKGFVGLAGDAIQVVNEFAANKRIPINYFDAEGKFTPTRLDQSVQYMPTSAKHSNMKDRPLA